MPRGTKRIREVWFTPNKDIIMYSGTSIYNKELRDLENLFAKKSWFNNNINNNNNNNNNQLYFSRVALDSIKC